MSDHVKSESIQTQNTSSTPISTPILTPRATPRSKRSKTKQVQSNKRSITDSGRDEKPPDFSTRHERLIKTLEEDLLENSTLEEPIFDTSNLETSDQEDSKENSTDILRRVIGSDVRSKNTSITLQQLITDFKRKFNKNDPYVENIKRPRLLIQALVELNDMIGMERLKESVTLQVMRLIDALNSGQADLGMLNTILYGEPGVGKTNIGLILAKIWHGLGFLENNAKSNEGWMTNMSEISDDQVTILIAIGMMSLSYGVTGGKLVYNKYGVKGLLVSGLILIAVIAAIWLAYINRDSDIIGSHMLEDSPESSESTLGLSNSNSSSSSSNSNSSNSEMDRSIIKVVSRKDFVAEYLGQTAVKTKKLLNANIGKVLFIDEAYSLYQNGSMGGDMYGSEALTTLNLFMSENPNKIVVIFAGYEGLMKNGIFKSQPGLPRRCMWHFQCDGYNGNQLGDIFLLQLKKKDWRVNDVVGIKKMIIDNSSLFPSHGGDTERLIFYSQLASSRNGYHEGGRRNHNILTTEDVSEGLQFLAENNIHKGENKSDTNTFDAEELLRRMNGIPQ
jgi:DNA polymerase III delta prime subunit